MSFKWWQDGDRILKEAIKENEQDGGGRMSSDEDGKIDSEAGGEADDISTSKDNQSA